MEKTERELIEAVQKSLEVSKKAIKRGVKTCSDIGVLNRDANRANASNAAMRMEGELNKALGILQAAHADASDALLKEWPEDGQIVVLGGGGGRA
jgi:hypothetical protein